ncbi:cache domain-containing protein [Microbacterium sp. 18062]|uniref:cache domain-containing protein n=1 Tax=Microbacterium sp. 18062 TaxID=2681410 RepID=UPI0013581F1B|nr:cache domain-containing protein [Microbacterium sp. 18062]
MTAPLTDSHRDTEAAAGDPAAAAHIVSTYFAALLDPLEAHADRIGDELGAHDLATLTASRVDELVDPHARSILDRPGEPVYGAGFITAMNLLLDTSSHLAWWQGADRRKLVFPAQSVKQAIDYRELEWFRVPRITGRSHVAGPYVDYLCSDEYTMTAAAPVTVNGTFVGVVGLDVLIDTIERRLTPPLRALATPLLLVNGVDRVLVSTDRRFSAGDVLRPDRVVIRDRRSCASIGLEVVTLG